MVRGSSSGSSSSSMCRVVLLLLLGLLVAFVHTAVADPAAGDTHDPMSGEPPADVTTREPDLYQDVTESAHAADYEDATQPPTIDEEEGVLGPGAITAIVIAVFLGASVLLALIVITLRKFTTS